MAFSPRDIRDNAEYFAAKKRATRAMGDVVARAEGDPEAPDFLLLDVRSRASFAKGHVPGAWSAPLRELDAIASHLPKDREYATYCGGGT